MLRSLLAVTITLWLSGPLLAFAGQQPPQTSIEGVIYRADTAQPLAGARVSLSVVTPGLESILPGGGGTPVAGNQPAITDREGKFSFGNLSPGTYRIHVVANGFAPRSYGQQTPQSPATPVALTSGQALQLPAIALMPEGTISGRVFDESSRPATGALVQVLRAVPGAFPTRYQPVATATVDDRGDYRMFGIKPGLYYLSVGNEIGPPLRPGGPNANLGSPPNFAFLLYPGVRSVDQAAPIDLRPGIELSIDMKTHVQETYRVRGLIVDSAGRPPAAINMKLYYRSLSGITSSQNLTCNYDPQTGRFEALNIPPGSYILQAQTQIFSDATRAAGEAAWSMFPTARVPIVVTDTDIEDVTMIEKAPVAIPGVVRFEGQNPAALQSAVFRLNPTADELKWTPPTAFVSPDGGFRVDGVLEATYSAEFQGLPQGLYIKSIQYAGTDILNQPLQFSGSVSGTIEVVLARGTAQLSGVVRDAQANPAGGVQVVLIPEQRGRSDLYRSAIADQNGRYSLSNLAPGIYKVFSWNASAAGAYYDQRFVDLYEQEGRMIRLPESSTGNLDLRVIPTR